MANIRVELPAHLRTLAGVGREVCVELAGEVTMAAVLDALEVRWPMLKGTIRDHKTRQRRAFLRFFACEQDFSHQSLYEILPEAVIAGLEPLLIVGAVAGGAA
jgi:sulfur-carrier protein